MIETYTVGKLLQTADQKIPLERLSTYTRLWQFESWLRMMVYVELRARYGDIWKDKLKWRNRNAYKNDKALSHMPTREDLPTSYMQLADHLETISANWYLFKSYLPPRNLWKAKLIELSQIRHRIAHFRLGHNHDLDRVEQLLRDADKGFWRFCTTYNATLPILPQSKDVVIKQFLHLDPFPYNEVKPNTWARLGFADPNLVVSATFEIMRRNWLNSAVPTQVAGKYGYFYDMTLCARNNREFEYQQFLENTKKLHQHLCHICLDSDRCSIRITIPAVLGKTSIVRMIEILLASAHSSARPASIRPAHTAVADIEAISQQRIRMVDALAEQWPEYILGPSNALTFLAPDMPCSFFDVS